MSGEGDELAGLIGRCLDRYLPGIPMDDCLRFMAATAAALRDAGWVAPALSFTEQEADRNARGGWRDGAHVEPIPCYEDDVSRCGCSTCVNQPKIPGPRPDREPPSQEPVRVPRPCCHTTGPNHHPACQESK